MKKDRRFIFIGIVLLLAVLAGLGWLLLREKKTVTHIEIPARLLETAEPSKFSIQPVDVVRQQLSDELMVLFPQVKRETRLSLYDAKGYSQLMTGESNVRPIYLHDAEKLRTIYGRPVINFSALPDGNYFAHLSSCNYGGYFCFRLTSKKNAINE